MNVTATRTCKMVRVVDVDEAPSQRPKRGNIWERGRKKRKQGRRKQMAKLGVGGGESPTKIISVEIQKTHRFKSEMIGNSSAGMSTQEECQINVKTEGTLLGLAFRRS